MVSFNVIADFINKSFSVLLKGISIIRSMPFQFTIVGKLRQTSEIPN